MIDYATLCKAIEDWKGGRQPAAAKPPKPAPRPPSRVPTRPVVPQEEEAVEYSAIYETGEAKEEPAESTVIYQLPDYEGEAEVDIGEDDR